MWKLLENTKCKTCDNFWKNSEKLWLESCWTVGRTLQNTKPVFEIHHFHNLDIIYLEKSVLWWHICMHSTAPCPLVQYLVLWYLLLWSFGTLIPCHFTYDEKSELWQPSLEQQWLLVQTLSPNAPIKIAWNLDFILVIWYFDTLVL